MNDTIVKAAAIEKSSRGLRNNNFNMVRFVATMFVFAGHMGVILGIQPPILSGFSLHELGVMMLFLIGGYLITQSWLLDPNPLRYAIRRFFRLWPPFAVFVLLAVFVAGPLISDLGVQGYFHSNFLAYLRNLRFFISYSQPGVFTNVPAANTTNGSLWTMPVEAFVYILTPLLLTLCRVKNRSKTSFRCMTVVTGITILFDYYLRIFWADKTVVVYGTELISAFHLIVMYIIGIYFTYDEVKKYLNLQLGCLVMCLLLFCQVLTGPTQHLVLCIVFPYFIFSFALMRQPLFGAFGKKVDLSYGIFLYGFFFQQLTVSLMLKYGINTGYLKTFAVSLIPTAAAAYFSYYLVEKPVMNLGHLLIRKLKNRENA